MDKKLKKALRAEVAGVANDITMPAMGGVFRQFDPTLQSKGAGYNVRFFDSVLNDAHALSVLENRVDAYAHRKWAIVDAENATAYDKKFAKFILDTFSKLEISRIRKERGIAKFLYGYAPGEIMYAIDGKNVVVSDIKNRDPTRFYIGEQGEIRLKTWANTFPGEVLPDWKILWDTHDRRSDNPYGRGYGAVLWWLVFFKREQQKQAVTFSGRFASPTVVATFDGNGTEDKAMEAAQGVSGESEIAVSSNVVLSLLESARHGTETVFLNSIGHFNEEMSKVVLGESLTTATGSTAARDAGMFQDSIRLVRSIADARADDASWNKVIKLLRDRNFPGAKLCTFETDMTDPNEEKKIAEKDAILFTQGVRRTMEKITELYGPGYERIPETAPAAAGSEQPKTPTSAGATQVNVNAAAA